MQSWVAGAHHRPTGGVLASHGAWELLREPRVSLWLKPHFENVISRSRDLFRDLGGGWGSQEQDAPGRCRVKTVALCRTFMGGGGGGREGVARAREGTGRTGTTSVNDDGGGGSATRRSINDDGTAAVRRGRSTTTGRGMKANRWDPEMGPKRISADSQDGRSSALRSTQGRRSNGQQGQHQQLRGKRSVREFNLIIPPVGNLGLQGPGLVPPGNIVEHRGKPDRFWDDGPSRTPWTGGQRRYRTRGNYSGGQRGAWIR